MRGSIAGGIDGARHPRHQLPSRNCTPDTFTATCQRGAPASRQRRTCAQASRSTQSPISTIRPFCSASGMNSSGGTKPRCGCRQRSNASTASTRRSLSGQPRLIVQRELPAFQRLAQIRLHRQVLGGARADRFLEELQSALTGLLAVMHGRVGILDESFGSGRVAGIQADADGGRQRVSPAARRRTAAPVRAARAARRPARRRPWLRRAAPARTRRRRCARPSR